MIVSARPAWVYIARPCCKTIKINKYKRQKNEVFQQLDELELSGELDKLSDLQLPSRMFQLIIIIVKGSCLGLGLNRWCLQSPLSVSPNGKVDFKLHASLNITLSGRGRHSFKFSVLFLLSAVIQCYSFCTKIFKSKFRICFSILFIMTSTYYI